MNTDNETKYYQIDIATLYAIADVAARDSMPVWLDIVNRCWSADEPEAFQIISGKSETIVGGNANLDSQLWFHDLSDKRQVFVKTPRRDEITAVRYLEGVKVTQTAPSGFFLVRGTPYNQEEQDEILRLKWEAGADSAREYGQIVRARFDTHVWPALKTDIMATIERHEPGAFFYFVAEARALIIETKSSELLCRLGDLDHAAIEEIEPMTSDDVQKAYPRQAERDDLTLPGPSQPPPLRENAAPLDALRL